SVEEHGEEDRQRGLVELRRAGLASTESQGVEAAEDRRDGEQVGQDELELVQLHRSPAPAADGPLSWPSPPGEGTLTPWTRSGPSSPLDCWSWPSGSTWVPCARTTGCAARVPSGGGSLHRTGPGSPCTGAGRRSAASWSRCSCVTGLPPTT